MCNTSADPLPLSPIRNEACCRQVCSESLGDIGKFNSELVGTADAWPFLRCGTSSGVMRDAGLLTARNASLCTTKGECVAAAEVWDPHRAARAHTGLKNDDGHRVAAPDSRAASPGLASPAAEDSLLDCYWGVAGHNSSRVYNWLDRPMQVRPDR